MAMLERTSELDHLDAFFHEAQAGNGRAVFVSGEMGIGKTTLVSHFTEQVSPVVRIARFTFDGLFIPAPLGPLLGVAQELGHDVVELLNSQAPRSSVFRAIEDSVRAAGLTLIVAEDAHWADEASLEFIRFLGRRIGTLPAMLIVTFRNDELAPGHPLRQVIGDLATEHALRRIVLTSLSVDAVRTLAAGTAIDPLALHAYTGGNPFFVTEILTAGGDTPVPIREAVLGRAARLGPDARETLEMAAAIGERVDPLVLAGVVGRPIEREIAAAFNAGLLRADGDAIAFRHAAVHAVIVGETLPVRVPILHERILAWLLRHPDAGATAARLAFHAEQAHDRPAAHRHAIDAASEATRLQSHREAADQYARALRCADGIAPQARAEMLESHAYACFLTSRMADAIVSQQAAADIWQAVGDQLRYGHNLRRLSRYWLYDGRQRIGAELAERSFAVLQAFPESAELAMACGYLAEWRIRADRLVEARELADRAMAIARRLEEPATTAHALISVGMVQLTMNDAKGARALDAGRTLAREIGHEEFELRAMTHLAEADFMHRYRAEAKEYAVAGLELARTWDLSTMVALYGSARLLALLDSGDWATAIVESDAMVASGGDAGRLRLIALLVAAKARVRSGTGEPFDLDPAIRQAHHLDDPIARAMVQSVRLEQAWLTGASLNDAGDQRKLLEDAYAAGDAWVASELALWQWRTGVLQAVPGWLVEPYAPECRGESHIAASMWEAAGAPLEALRARSALDEEVDLRHAHAGFIALGAKPDAIRVARRMQALGYRGIPRGPRPSTRQNPALLSRREIEVLIQLAQGFSNREIATKLCVSPKTIDHHVSSILGKLGVESRQRAVVRAREAGILPK